MHNKHSINTSDDCGLLPDHQRERKSDRHCDAVEFVTSQAGWQLQYTQIKLSSHN